MIDWLSVEVTAFTNRGTAVDTYRLLLTSRRFLPLLLTQILGTLTDNLLKSAFLVLLTYGEHRDRIWAPEMLAPLAGACLLSPYVLLSASAGQIADRYERAWLLQRFKLAELAMVAAAALALLFDTGLVLPLITLFLMGMQATFSSPVRYALLPQYLAVCELVAGNALLEAGTFLSIMIGTVGGSIVAAASWGLYAVAAMLVICAVLGLGAAFLLPPAPAPSPHLRIGWNLFAETASILRQAAERREVRRSILGASWFWLVGTTLLAEFPSFAKDYIGADSGVVTLFLGAFTIGIGTGSTLCGRILNGEVSARHLPLAALAITILALDLWAASPGPDPLRGGKLIGAAAFLASPAGLRLTFDFFGIAVAGGFFVVPLYAIMQSHSDEANRARVLAANNVVNAAFVTGAALAVAALLGLGLDVPGIFAMLAIANLAVVDHLRHDFGLAWLPWGRRRAPIPLPVEREHLEQAGSE